MNMFGYLDKKGENVWVRHVKCSVSSKLDQYIAQYILSCNDLTKDKGSTTPFIIYQCVVMIFYVKSMPLGGCCAGGPRRTDERQR